MSIYGGQSSLFEDQPFRANKGESIQPLGYLGDFVDIWAERRVSPPAVVRALGHLVDRQLSDNEKRNATEWLIEETERHQARQGEQ
jgi:hypothetical protein